MARYTLPGDTTVFVNTLDNPIPAAWEVVFHAARGGVSVKVRWHKRNNAYEVTSIVQRPGEPPTTASIDVPNVTEVKKVVARVIRIDPG
jgi:hypothetical protein